MSTLHVYTSKTKAEPVASLRDASAAVRSYIEAQGLGASEWYGGKAGDVFDANGVRVAHVSYNGRLWEADRKTPRAEGGAS